MTEWRTEEGRRTLDVIIIYPFDIDDTTSVDLGKASGGGSDSGMMERKWRDNLGGIDIHNDRWDVFWAVDWFDWSYRALWWWGTYHV